MLQPGDISAGIKNNAHLMTNQIRANCGVIDNTMQEWISMECLQLYRRILYISFDSFVYNRLANK